MGVFNRGSGSRPDHSGGPVAVRALSLIEGIQAEKLL